MASTTKKYKAKQKDIKAEDFICKFCNKFQRKPVYLLCNNIVCMKHIDEALDEDLKFECMVCTNEQKHIMEKKDCYFIDNLNDFMKKGLHFKHFRKRERICC